MMVGFGKKLFKVHYAKPADSEPSRSQARVPYASNAGSA